MDIYGFYRGDSFDAYGYLGAHLTEKGTIFRTYAPNAGKVAVVGDFNGWNDEPMKPVEDGRFYELLCPGAKEGMRYKYRIYDKNGDFIDHCDPYGYGMEVRPGTCSVIRSLGGYTFGDSEWLASRSDCRDKPLNIYEVHLGSWKRRDGFVPREKDEPAVDENGMSDDEIRELEHWYTYSEIAGIISDYAAENGYTHIELMPLAEHQIGRAHV